MPGIALLGAALIVAGVIVSEMKRRSVAGEFVAEDEASLNEEGLRNVE
ncbi:Uncharacterized protein AC506_3425 [Pseudomonas syringae pv. maculicola str. M6]|nr:Uncharacterized protein AC506_3425 [Pseudomonas syringae pv. maculicola str. M6]